MHVHVCVIFNLRYLLFERFERPCIYKERLRYKPKFALLWCSLASFHFSLTSRLPREGTRAQRKPPKQTAANFLWENAFVRVWLWFILMLWLDDAWRWWPESPERELPVGLPPKWTHTSAIIVAFLSEHGSSLLSFSLFLILTRKPPLERAWRRAWACRAA